MADGVDNSSSETRRNEWRNLPSKEFSNPWKIDSSDLSGLTKCRRVRIRIALYSTTMILARSLMEKKLFLKGRLVEEETRPRKLEPFSVIRKAASNFSKRQDAKTARFLKRMREPRITTSSVR